MGKRWLSVALAVAVALVLGVSACGPQDATRAPGTRPMGSAPATSGASASGDASGPATASSSSTDAVLIGDPVERAAILDALRAPVEKHLLQPARFAGVEIGVASPFAYVLARPVRSDGGDIDYSRIPEFAPAVEADAFDDYMEALLRKRGGRWEVLEYRIGPTDTALEEWQQTYKMPAKQISWGE